ncbi:GntR family transcriptional regulator [Sulfitobacter sp. S190]|uniref:GntR family transcriptional regulator n=1 Tax=Sulfitobacter sp. S190 TaxID=2867022 RepID=UPI0021A439D9|nr:GntR family transcriptional regulator [Sulfitobacter sp. S190]UWR21882.1 GntR family transcriptional regulator [Sulfitobacter sp. S190]
MHPAPPARDKLPAYIQIAEVVARNIASGRLLDGDKLPTERAMAEEYQVAVGTLRKALDVLVEQGHVERRQGSGNYIRHADGARSVYALLRLELRGGGGLPTAEILAIDHVRKPAGAPQFGSSAMAHRFRRLRFLDGKAAALEEIFIDADRSGAIDAQAVSESLYYFYQHDLGILVSRATDTIGLGHVPDWTLHRFGPDAQSPVPFVERVAYDQNTQPFEYSRTWIDADIAAYVSRLK